MGVAGSKVSEPDEGKDLPRSEPSSVLHNYRGIKRRRTDVSALRISNKRKAFTESGSHQHVDLVIQSLVSGRSYISGRRDNEGLAASDSSRTELLPAGGLHELILSADDLNNNVLHHTVRSPRDDSEELLPGWAVSAVALKSQSQRHHNVIMVRKTIADLRALHLMSGYSRENLQLSTTSMTGQSTVYGSRVSRRTSLQPSVWPELHRRGSIDQNSEAVSVTSTASKSSRAERVPQICQSSNWVQKDPSRSMQSQLASPHVRNLEDLWREDDGSGWSGLLGMEF